MQTSTVTTCALTQLPPDRGLEFSRREFGRKKALFDLRHRGYLTNNYPKDSPEHEGYAAFQDAHNRTVARAEESRRIAQQA